MVSASLYAVLLLTTIISSLTLFSSAFVSPSTSTEKCIATTFISQPQRTASIYDMSTTVIPGTETEKREKADEISIPPGQGDIRGPIEWLIDDTEVSRNADDPFHILLLDETFVNNDRITIDYVASSCAYVLSMPYDEAAELASHAEQEGFSCLGTWGHEECVRLGGQLQQRDLSVRVVPFCEGGDRAWQARKADDEMKSANEGAEGFN